MTVELNSIALGRARPRWVLAGSMHVPAIPKISAEAKDLVTVWRLSMEARLRFLWMWGRRALGVVRPRTLDDALLEVGLTMVLPGIEAESILTYGICDGLAEGGVPGAIRVFNWGLPFPGGYLANLTRIDRNRRRAADLAAEICRYQDRFPGRPVNVVAQSGGAGVAVFAVEALPAGREIESLVLLGAAMSPTYDLSRALSRVRKGVLNSYSERDKWILGWGTKFFGTTDRKFTAAAGRVGFVMPEGLGAEGKKLYDEKLVQLAWRKEMADAGVHWGGHICCGSEIHVTRHIAPWVLDDKLATNLHE